MEYIYLAAIAVVFFVGYRYGRRDALIESMQLIKSISQRDRRQRDGYLYLDDYSYDDLRDDIPLDDDLLYDVLFDSDEDILS